MGNGVVMLPTGPANARGDMEGLSAGEIGEDRQRDVRQETETAQKCISISVVRMLESHILTLDA